MAWNEILWVSLGAYGFFLALSLQFRKTSMSTMLRGTTAIMGFFVGLYLINSVVWLSGILIIFNAYLLYTCLIATESGKGKT